MMNLPSYIFEVDSVLSQIDRDKLLIVYLESNYPDVLDLVLDPKQGSLCLKEWLGIPNEHGFADACRSGAARPFDEVYDSTKGKLLPMNDAKAPKDSVAYELKKSSDPKRVEFRLPYTDVALQIAVSLAAEVNQDLIELSRGKSDKCTYIQMEGVKQAVLCQVKRVQGSTANVRNECSFLYLNHADAIEQNTLSKMLRAFLEGRKNNPSVKLILTGVTRSIPSILSDQIQLIELGSPTVEDIQEQLRPRLIREGSPFQFRPEAVNAFARNLTGLTQRQLENVYVKLGLTEDPAIYMLTALANDPKRLSRAVWEQKLQESKKDNIIVFKEIDEDPGVVGVGGFDRWLNENLPYLVNPDEATRLGIKPASGVIFSGVPGTGKTQMAKLMAYRWGKYPGNKKTVSFIEFNIGNLSSSEYGKSEALMMKFLKRINEQAPAVLLVDEVEKTFYRNKKGDQEMHEVKKQIMGMFLGWLQEHKANVVTFMTSNDISVLPPELLRSGRLSERFFVFLPSFMELMCMLYVFLSNKKALFCQEFNNKIQKLCDSIKEYSREYGRNDEHDARLDADLKEELKDGPLAAVLPSLIRYAVNQMGERDIQWDEVFNDQEQVLRTPFMTGADLNELVRRTTLRLMSGEQKDKLGRWTEEDFARTMKDCCCSPQFMPYGQSNMETLVDLYLSCDYLDVSAHPLLPRYQYNVLTGRFKLDGDKQYIEGTHPDNLYDQYMQRMLVREIERAACEKRREKDRWEREEAIQKAQIEQIQHQREAWEEEKADKLAAQEERRLRREYLKKQYDQMR